MLSYNLRGSRRLFSLLIIAILLLSVLSVALVVKPAEAAPDAPQYRNVGPADGTSVSAGENLTLYAQGYSDVGLDYAWLSTDETGSWKNYTKLWTDWQASESNPIVDGDSVLGGSGYWTEDSKVIKVDGTYYMAIANGPSMGAMQIYMLNSSSLTGPWNVINSSQPIIPHGSPGSWDQGQLRVAGPIVYDSGTYYLYYMGTSAVQSIGVATTSDAQFPNGWTKYSGNPILTPTGSGWESGGIYTLSMARIGPPGSEWYAHYTAHTSYIWSLGICYGSSPYGPFTRHVDNPILERGLGEWDNLGLPRTAMTKIGDMIYGAYESAMVSGGPPNWDFQVGGYEGEITDGILDVTFSKNPNNPIIPGNAGSALQTANPHWYYENGTRYLFVGSCGQGTGPTWRYIDLFSSSGLHGSPMDMRGVADTWTWSNFAWSNSSIAAGTTIQWRIYYKDAAGNVNGTGIHSFTVKPPEYDYPDLDTSDLDGNGDKGTHSNFENEKACDSIYDTLSEENTAGFGIMSYRKNVTINHHYVSGDLNNFPVLVNIYDADLHNDVQSSGNDIAFTDSSGKALDHEIEYFNKDHNATHAHLVAWVRANLTSALDTTICMVYGDPACGSQQNPTGVWDSNFVGVWHMNQVDASDSTSNGNDGTQSGGVTQTSSGKVNGANSFDGIDDSIRVFHDSSLDLIDDFTIELWMKPDVLTQTSRYLLSKLSGVADNTYSILWEYTDNQAEFYSGAFTGSNPRPGSGITISDTNWHYVCYAYDGSVWSGFRDNTTVFSLSRDFDLTTTTGNLFFADVNGGATYNFNGMLDEIRISNIGRSAAWINTTYHCVQNQTSFRTIGNEETAGTPNYELDLEIQWVNVDYNRALEELCIRTGTFSGSENIQVRIWNSTDNAWDWIMNLTANQWNNISVTSYLTESTFTVQFLGGTESGDTDQDSWNIDCSLIHAWNPPQAPIISNPSPPNGATGVSVSLSQLSFTLTEPQGDLMNYSVTTSPNIGSDSGINVGDGPYTVAVTRLAHDTTYTCQVNITDGIYWTNVTYSFATETTNNPPTASNLAITPSLPYTTDNLVGSYTYSDADGDAESGTEIRWYRNGLVQPLYNDLLTVPSSATSPGEMWHFTVRPSDGTDFGTLETSLPVTIVTPVTYIFSDGFESGDFSEWEGTYVTAGTSAAVTADSPHHGSYQAAFTLGASQYGRATAYLTNALEDVYIRVYWKTSSLFDSNTYNQIGIDLSLTSLGSSRCYPIYNFASNKWGVRAWVGGSWMNYYETGTSSLSIDTWYCLELHLDQDPTSGVIQLWVDGALKIDESGDTSGTSMDRIQVGGWLNSAQDGSRTVFIDCVAVSDEYIGTEEAQPPPPDTTPPFYSNVGANETFAGQPCLFSAEWFDNVGLGGYVFSTNNTGTWTNYTWTPLAGLSDWSNVTKVLNPTAGVTVSYRFYCNDTSDNWNSTPITSLIITEPSAWYTSELSILVSSSSALVGYKVNMVGTLVFQHNGSGIANAPIRLHYSITGGDYWSLIASTATATNGSYYATWYTMHTSNYEIKAVYEGEESSNIIGTETTVNLVITDIEEEAFSVSSNSTISDLTFNSTAREITLSVSGPDGTTGYLSIFLSKNLVSDANDLTIYFDGSPQSFDAIPIDNIWFIHLAYSHSSHVLRLSLSRASPASVPLEHAAQLLAIASVLVALLVAALFSKRRLARKPPHTIAQ